MDANGSKQDDSIIQDLTGFKPKEFILIIVVAYMSVLTLPMILAGIGLPALPAVIGIMLIQFFVLRYVVQLHGKSILKTMTANGFLGWLMWLSLVCMLMLPIIHLLSLFGLIPMGAFTGA